jgi:hypothetical protein
MRRIIEWIIVIILGVIIGAMLGGGGILDAFNRPVGTIVSIIVFRIIVKTISSKLFPSDE